MIVFSNQILLVFSLYDLCCVILTTGKQVIAFKKGTFAPLAPPTQRQEGRLLPLPPSPACLGKLTLHFMQLEKLIGYSPFEMIGIETLSLAMTDISANTHVMLIV